VVPIPAATIVLLRERAGGGVETLLMRRHRKSTFMSDTFVFPGGKVDPEDRSPEEAAIRELFEEAGVLLVVGGTALEQEQLDRWRRELNAGAVRFRALLERERLEPDLSRLHPWARWVTPSVEPKRFDARFYLAELPPGQRTSYDSKETVEEAWVAPDEGITRHLAGGLKLPPPQLRTLHELAEALRAAGDRVGAMAALADASRARAPYIAPLMPRFADLGQGTMGLLMPWDPEYATRGTGEAVEWPGGQPLGVGPSRFVLEGMSWRLEYAARAG
jgi:8-oxo-dGTP pyrophosphatase MutT (NUDIX family)